MKKLDEFTAGGGTLTGGGQSSHETYEGDPKPYNSKMQTDRTDADVNFHAHDGLHDHQRAVGSSGDGLGATTAGSHTHDSNLENKIDPRVDSDRSAVGGTTETGAETGTGTGVGMGGNATGTGKY